MCLVLVRRQGGGWPRNPPAHALAALSRLTDLPVLPASQCTADAFPVVIATEANAMLYSVRVEGIARDGRVTFWPSAVCGKLCAYSKEHVLQHERGRWVVEPTGRMAIS